MKQLERILWGIVLLAILLKVFHLPLASFLLIISMSLLNLVYFFLSWLLFPQPTRKDQIVTLSIVAGLFLCVGQIGLLFKIQQWPMSAFYLILGGAGLVILTVLIILIRTSRSDLADYTGGLLRRTLPMLVVCVLLYLLPSATLTAFYFRDDPEVGRLWIQHNDSNDPEERNQLRLRIDSIHEARGRAGFESQHPE